MAITKVATNALIDQLIRRMRFKAGDSTTRANMLAAINRANQHIAQRHSLSYLQVKASITLALNASAVAAPAGMDPSKDATIERADLKGVVPYYPRDEFHQAGSYTYAAWEVGPYGGWTTYWDYSGDPGNPVLFFQFTPPNANVSPCVMNVIYQRIPETLTDGGTSYSSLPPGYELTILLDRAEADEKRVANTPNWQMLLSKNESDLEQFYSAFRVSKEKPMTDDDAQRRAAVDQRKAEGLG